jgi:hypothetical protein
MFDSLDSEIAHLERSLEYGREHPYSGVCGEDDAAADRLDFLRAERAKIEAENARRAATSPRLDEI